jgi:hypothetical protein
MSDKNVILASVKASSNKSSGDSLDMFPTDGDERAGYKTWAFKALAVVEGKGLGAYLDQPLFGLPDIQGAVFDENDELDYIMPDKQITAFQHTARSAKVYGMLCQSLHEKQINIIQDIRRGNAYAVWQRLYDNYGTIKSAPAKHALIQSLGKNEKQPPESLPDYFARCDRIIRELDAQSATPMDDSNRRFNYLNGLRNDPKWSKLATLVQQIDIEEKWSMEQLKQYFIGQENADALLKSSDSKQVSTGDSKVEVKVEKALSAQRRFDNRGRGGFRGRTRGRGRASGRGRFHQNNDNNHQQNNHQSPSPHSSHNSNRSRGRSSFRGRKNHHNSDRDSFTCNYCGKRGHFAKDCRDNPHASVQCYKCGNYGHISPNCTTNNKNKRNRDDENDSNDDNDHNTNNSSFIASNTSHNKRFKHSVYVVINTANHAYSVNDTVECILDSGASDHYFSVITLMTHLRTIHPPRTLQSANGTSICDQVGEVVLRIDNDHTLTLTDVGYVPDFYVNLISVSKIVQTGADVIYKRNEAQIIRNGVIDIIFPRRQDNLYSIHAHTSSVFVTMSLQPSTNAIKDASNTSSSTDISSIHQPPIHIQKLYKQLHSLHLKHAHISYHTLIKMVKNNSINHGMHIRIVSENELTKYLSTQVCDACMKGKMKRKPMTGKIDYKLTGIMQLLVFDTMIFTVKTMSGCRYITLTIDVYSTETFIGVHLYKSDIPDYLIDLIVQLQTQLGVILKRLHSDGGTEVELHKVNDFLRKQGTIHTTTTTDTPQHNSIVERRNQTTMTKTSAVMHHANAYTPLYAEAATCVVYVENRTINTRTDVRTPIQMRTHEVVNTTHFHVWGCDVYYHVHESKRENKKLDDRAIMGIFVGYDTFNESYYRVLNVDSLKMIRTRDVRFVDDEFTEMRRLRIMKRECDDEYHEFVDIQSIMLHSSNYLPDSVLNDKVAVERMFPDQSSSNPSSSQLPPKNNDMNIDLEKDKENGKDKEDNQDKEKERKRSKDKETTRADDEYIPDNNKRHRSSSISTSSLRSSSLSRTRRSAHPTLIDGISYSTSVMLDEPLTYEEAMNSKDKDKWKGAIEDELNSHHKNNTWSIVDRTSEMNVIGSKWVFKIKRDNKGRPLKYKARLVAKGYNQQYGIDYTETFAPVLKYKSLRIMLALALFMNAVIEQLDVKTAFLNATVNELIFIEIPEGMNIINNYVLKLNQALYGIKQAPFEWHREIDRMLTTLGYTACRKDLCLYHKLTKTMNIILIGLFVDDITTLYVPSDRNEWLNDKRALMQKYEMSDLGEVHHILGMRVERNSEKLIISQDVYIQDKLEEFRFDKARSVSTPGTITGTQTTSHMTDDSLLPLSLQGVTLYRQMVGSLMYASISTRPDITHATNIAARHMSNPSEADMIKVRRIFKYLTNARHYGLVYMNQHHGGVVKLHAYSDADWAGDITDRKSTTGYCTFMNNNLISWSTKKQSTVALSSCEAEYMAISDVVKEIMWMRILLEEIDIQVETPTIIYVDNQSAIKISENDSAHDRTKHIAIRHYYIRDCIDDGSVKLEWVRSEDQLADILTKPLTPSTFTSIRDRLIQSNNTHNNDHHDEL